MRCKAWSGHRRQQVWDAAARHRAPALLRGAPVHERRWPCPAPEGEIVFDYAATGLTLRRHPLVLLRFRAWRAHEYLNAQQRPRCPMAARPPPAGW